MPFRKQNNLSRSVAFAVAITLGSAVGLFAQAKPVLPQAGIAFVDVTVINVVDGTLLPGMTVVIRNNRISTIGRTEKMNWAALRWARSPMNDDRPDGFGRVDVVERICVEQNTIEEAQVLN